MRDDLVDIDSPPEVAVEVAATVEETPEGRPVLLPTDAGRWVAALKRLVGKPIRVALIREKNTRTGKQNRYLHGVVYVDILLGMRQLAQELGCEPPFRSKDDVHEWAKWKWLRTRRVFPGGEEEEMAGSTRKLTTKEFTEYADSIAAWGAQRGIYVRRPGEQVAA